MKKVLYLSFLILALPYASEMLADSCEKYENCFDGAFTAGYVFKHDCEFDDVYGNGIIDAITADGCYYPWKRWGLGAKLSYWRRKGSTSFLQFCTVVQQLPFTLYVRRRKELDCGLQLYASLGGGLIWTKEKSYLGKERVTKAIGEAEVGLRYPLWCGVGLTGAFRVLFPSQTINCEKVRVGGFDLRAGISFSF